MNLMPDSTLRWQAFNQKKPYFIATIFSVVIVAFAAGYLFSKLADLKDQQIATLTPQAAALQAQSEKYKAAMGKLAATTQEMNQISALMNDRYYWGDVCAELRRVLILSENGAKTKLSAQKPNVEVGVWIETMVTDSAVGGAAAPVQMMTPRSAPGMRGGHMPSMAPPPVAVSDPSAAGAGATIQLTCRAVDLSSVDPSANTAIAFEVENQMKASPLFDPKATVLSPTITSDPTTGTFTFGITVALQNPLKL
jgi:hypothetical protein